MPTGTWFDTRPDCTVHLGRPCRPHPGCRGHARRAATRVGRVRTRLGRSLTDRYRIPRTSRGEHAVCSTAPATITPCAASVLLFAEPPKGFLVAKREAGAVADILRALV